MWTSNPARRSPGATCPPDSFATETTLNLGDSAWLVEKAVPGDKVTILASGSLTLTLRRIEVVPARDILFSLPTICDTLPTVDQSANDAGRLTLHQDDWRQVELVDAGLADVVELERRAVRRSGSS